MLTFHNGIATDNEANNQCMRAWHLTDPRDDRERILSTKDPLLDGSCTWLFEDPAFTRWQSDDECRILWIHGDAGKGKTMMMMAAIDEITRRVQSRADSEMLSYFFCQNTIQELNTATAIIRGLIYHLVMQKPELVHHLRKDYDRQGSKMFEGVNAIHTLWRTLSEVLKDPVVSKVYLLVDALDESDADSTATFLKLLTTTTSKPWHKVRWIISSRNELGITETLRCAGVAHNTSLELNSVHVARAVESFIEIKVGHLATRKKYTNAQHESTKAYLTKHADGTFLWVALVCKELEKVAARKTQKVLERFPAGLEPLYARMMKSVRRDEDEDEDEVELREGVLRTVTLARRPLDLTELGILAGFEKELNSNVQYLRELVESCGSFLTIRGHIVYFVHQSAKDFFTTGKGSTIFPLGQQSAHVRLAYRSLAQISEHLKRDICGLERPDASAQDVEERVLHRCLPRPVQYACCYWVHHLQGCPDVLSDSGPVYTFLKVHLLHWLEALSLLQRTSDGVLMMKQLREWVQVSTR